MPRKRKIPSFSILSALVVLLCYCNFSVVPEETTVNWISTFNTDYSLGGFQETFDKGYIILVDTWDDKILLIKTDSQGKAIWQKSNIDSYYGTGNCIQHTNDRGFIIITGSYLIKTDTYGNKVWAKGFTGGGYGAYGQQTYDGGYIIIGRKDWDVYLLKTDSKGNKIWEKTFGGNEDYDWGNIVQQTFDGGYIISGYSHSTSIGKGIYIIKTDSEGNQIWYKTINNSPYSICWDNPDIKQTTDGDYIVLSTIYNEDDETDSYLIKLDSEGNISWSKTYGERGKNEGGDCIQLTSDEGFILAGGKDVIKTDLNGEVLWKRRIRGKYNTDICDIIESYSGGYVIGGKIFDKENDLYEIFLMKIGE